MSSSYTCFVYTYTYTDHIEKNWKEGIKKGMKA